MSSPTLEQQHAIDASGKNIIVSAGAGSGKTFVLKERVLRLLKSGISINELVILTFTNNAAAEMKNRIRKIINDNPEVSDQAPLVDSAYITTFDSYAQSLVKKYNYLLNISKDFSIIDANIVDIELNRIIDNIFDRKYKNEDSSFLDMIRKNCYKDDIELKKQIITMYNALDSIANKNEYLDTYIDKYYSDEFINEAFNTYKDDVFKRRDKLLYYLEELDNYTLKEEARLDNNKVYEDVSSASTLDELSSVINFSLARANKGTYDNDYKYVKDKISGLQNEISKLLLHVEKDIIEQYKSTKDSVKEIVQILKEIDKEIMYFKDQHNSYEFCDIAFKAIELVRDHEDVRNELKNSIKEIMIDEYQDTNDIQEEFIKYIENNNVYMVGDVKQSIYRFRNANPYIFKNKYDSYKDGIKGIKIDLTSNFRSREEVINNINSLFSLMMTDTMGGANYKLEHCMKFGRTGYNEHIYGDYNLEVLNYNHKDIMNASTKEIEAFIIAKDIKKKINEVKYAAHDVNNNLVKENISYKDFCVLVDRGTNFELLKKIFEYEGIPTTIYKDVSIKEDDEVFILKNLISLLIHIMDNNIDYDFKHAYLSIGRSYIGNMNDQELFDIYMNNSYKDTDLYKKLDSISNIINGLSNREILTTLIDEFDIVNKLVTVGNIDERTKKLEFFVNNATNLNKFGMDIYSLNEYFERLLEGDSRVEMPMSKDTGDTVRIMTIHKSKGLEFNYVYMPYLGSKFMLDKHGMTKKYGIIIKYNIDDIVGNTFTSFLFDNDERRESISEKIRLFYVAITRAKEKFILVNDYKDSIEPMVSPGPDDFVACNSYRDMVALLWNFFDKYKIDIDVNSLGISKDYNDIKDSNYLDKIDSNDTKINITKLDYDSKLLDNKHFSKPLNHLIDKNLRNTLDMGTYMHYVFEVTNFNPLNIDSVNVSEEIKDKVKAFLKHDEVKNIKDAKVYKEHEIRFEKDGSIYHGFIDLLVEYPDHFDIIDYKLSNTDSEEYVLQLNGYKSYIQEKYHKTTNIYLYSINKDEFKKLD